MSDLRTAVGTHDRAGSEDVGEPKPNFARRSNGRTDIAFAKLAEASKFAAVDDEAAQFDVPALDSQVFSDTIISVLQGKHGLAAEVPSAPAVENPTALRRLSDTPERFRIRLANSEGRRSAASYLVRKRYSWRGYEVGDSQAHPKSLTLMAGDDTRALATISVGFDSPAGLLVDELYRAEVDSLRDSGARLCEFTKLAVETGERSREVLAMIFHIAYMYARRLYHCTDLLIEVNPRHVRFYRAALGFQQFGPPRACPRVNAPAILLRLDLAHCEEQIARFGGHRELADKMRSLYPLAFSPQEEAGICGRLSQMG